jgi:hypothetical protein
LGFAFAFGLGFAFVATFFFGAAFLVAVFFGAAFLTTAFFVVFFSPAVDALFDAVGGSWIRRVVKNVRRVAANADEVNTEEDATCVRNTGRPDTRRRAKREIIWKNKSRKATKN